MIETFNKLREFLRYLWHHDSNSACLVIIDVAESLNSRDRRQMAEYLKALDECDRMYSEAEHQLTLDR